jgi:repressor LexA
MVFDFIQDTIQDQGYPPTLREIGNHMGIRSTNGVSDHLKALERKGYLQRGSLRARALIPIALDSDKKNESRVISIPMLGTVAAGQPIPRIEDNGPQYQVDMDLVGTSPEMFSLRIQGESMILDGIHNDDLVFVRKQSTANNGDTVVAVVDGEVTVKRFYDDDDHIRLQPANDAMEPMLFSKNEWREVSVLGIVTGLFRKF